MDLLILGASARSAAQSALRAGLSPPIAVDLFNDRDLVASCREVVRISGADYPDAFERIAATLPPAPWIYTGALENSPDLVDCIARVRPLLGIGGEALRRVRDPWILAETLAAARLPFADVRRSADGLPKNGSWLEKPLRSSSGRGIRPVDSDRPADVRCYFQRRIEGESLSALFVGERLIGITRQIQGRPGNPFAFVGNMGPWPVSQVARSQVAAIGRCLAGGFGLLGVFGVDFVLTPDDRPVPVEVNPRYTASVEVLERALGISILRDHLAEFAHLCEFLQFREAEGIVAKAIVFAEVRSRLSFSEPPNFSNRRGERNPAIADIPMPGSIFEPGDPVLSVFARGATVEECASALDRNLASWRQRLVPA